MRDAAIATVSNRRLVKAQPVAAQISERLLGGERKVELDSDGRFVANEVGDQAATDRDAGRRADEVDVTIVMARELATLQRIHIRPVLSSAQACGDARTAVAHAVLINASPCYSQRRTTTTFHRQSRRHRGWHQPERCSSGTSWAGQGQKPLWPVFGTWWE
jgi:hypothetical protein